MILQQIFSDGNGAAENLAASRHNRGRRLTAVAFLLTGFLPIAVAETVFSPYVDEQGNISFPDGFRTDMVHLGSWFVPDGGASGFHDVYTEKESVLAFRKQGSFPTVRHWSKSCVRPLQVPTPRARASATPTDSNSGS